MGLFQTEPPTAEPVTRTTAKLHLRIDHATDDSLIDALITAAREYVELRTFRVFIAQTWRLTMDTLAGEIELPKPPLLGVSSVQYVDTAGATQTVAASVYTVDTTVEPAVIREAPSQSWPATRGEPNDAFVNFVAGYAVPFASTFATDLLTLSGFMFEDEDPVRVYNKDGDLPSGLVALTMYYVGTIVGATCKLSATAGGAVLPLADDGTGAQFISHVRNPSVPLGLEQAMLLLIGHWYEHREAWTDGRVQTQVKQAVESLIWAKRIPAVDS